MSKPREAAVTVETVSRPRFGHGGARVGAGRKKGIPNRWPGVLQVELRRLVKAVDRLHEQRRNEHEALPILLKRVTSIERRLGIVEVPVMPRPSRRYPTGL
jgi:hypothetical protein